MKSSLDSSNTSGISDSTSQNHIRELLDEDSNPDRSRESRVLAQLHSARLDVCRRFGQPRRMTPASSPQFMLKHGGPHIAE